MAATPSISRAGDRGPCYAPQDPEQQGAKWDPKDYDSSLEAYGVEAPVQLRIGASICERSETGESVDQVSNWIAIEDTQIGAISQAGFVQLFADMNAGTTKNCRFWASDVLGTVHAYKCNSDNFADYVYFKIVLNNGHYRVLDCGSHANYQNCTEKSATAPEYFYPRALVAAEANHTCGNHFAGRASAKANIGSNASPLMGQSNSLGPFKERPFSGTRVGTPDCSDYHRLVVQEAGGTSNVQSVGTWDDRN